MKTDSFVTKKYLNEKLSDLKEDLREEMAINSDKLREEMAINNDRMDEKNRGYRDEVLTGLDNVMKELETMREENTVGFFQVNKKLEDHEKRISKLEAAAS